MTNTNQMTSKTVTQQKADAINEATPFVRPPEQDDDAAWSVVSGSEKKEYFARSPWASITAYERGFVVHNFVTGCQHPKATWKEAEELRSELKNRYVAISNF